MNTRLEFSVYVPQLGFTFDDIRRRVLLAEELGYDAVWFMDHLMAPGLPQVPSFEGWTVASALATQTSKIRLGHLVLCSSFRHPALLAKMACTLDVISGGRLNLGIGTGSVPAEHRIYGLPFPSFAERTGRMEETVKVLKLLFTQDETTMQGEFFTLNKATCVPKPVQKPHPPIYVGGGGEKYTLPLVARLADAWNCPVGALDQLERKIALLRDECRRIGRDPATLKLTEQAVLVLVPDRKGLDEAMAAANRRYPSASWKTREGGFVGTPEDIVRNIRERAALGVSHFTFFFHDRATLASLELFAREVMPAFRK